MNFERDMRDLSLLICTISLIAGLISCDNVKSNYDRADRFQDDRRNVSETVSFYDQPEKAVRTTTPSRKEVSRIESDNSLVETMFDNHGNKTESRYFNNNPLLKMVVLRVTPDGQTEAIVYGQNGDIKQAPPEIAKNIMKSTAKEIAKSVDISEGTIRNEIPAMIAAQNPTPEILPLPFSENSPVTAQTSVVKTENIVKSEMLSDQLIKPKKQNGENKPDDADIKPYDIPQN